jgi:hypothetical protein
MKKPVVVVMAVALAFVMVLSAGVGVVQAGIGSEIPDNGKHYNLNIIGVPHNKTADMKDSNRHTIFVPLGENGVPKSVKIYVVRNYANPSEFQVLDGNACDEDGATIAVPFEDYGTLSFNVYATALGKPGGHAKVDATVTFEEGTYGELLMTSFELKRENGKGTKGPKPLDISKIFRATGWIDVCGEMGVKDPSCDITFTNVWVFNVPTLLEYLWDYNNQGLKLMQVRFYPTTSGTWTNVPK